MVESQKLTADTKWLLSGTAFAPPNTKTRFKAHGYDGKMRHLALHERKPLTGVQNVFSFLGVKLHHHYESELQMMSPEEAVEVPGETHLGTTPRQWHWDSPLGNVWHQLVVQHLIARHTKDSIGVENKTTNTVDLQVTAPLNFHIFFSNNPTTPTNTLNPTKPTNLF
jgi:hypothetical protein